MLSQIELWISKVLLYGLFMSGYSNRVKQTIKNKKNNIINIDTQISNSYLNMDIDLDEHMNNDYLNLLKFFKILCISDKIWDKTFVYLPDALDKSGAKNSISRKEVSFKINCLDVVKCNLESMHLVNANGADMFIYPGFLIMYESNKEIAIVDFKDLIFNANSVNIIEKEKLPGDAEILYYTWNKVNKNGKQDKRFKDNYQIPVVQYGELHFKTNNGLNESFIISNNPATIVFGILFENYIKNFK
jgi:hypothetical protein